jgi:hypothetical protein
MPKHHGTVFVTMVPTGGATNGCSGYSILGSGIRTSFADASNVEEFATKIGDPVDEAVELCLIDNDAGDRCPVLIVHHRLSIKGRDQARTGGTVASNGVDGRK